MYYIIKDSITKRIHLILVTKVKKQDVDFKATKFTDFGKEHGYSFAGDTVHSAAGRGARGVPQAGRRGPRNRRLRAQQPARPQRARLRPHQSHEGSQPAVARGYQGVCCYPTQFSPRDILRW